MKNFATIALFALLSASTAAASANSCTAIFAPRGASDLALTPDLLGRLDTRTGSWVEVKKTKFKSLDTAVLKNIESQSLTVVVAGGSSVHAVLPPTSAGGAAVSAKIYFRAPGPQTLEALTNDIVDAALPSLKHILSTSKGRAPVLVVPAPGQLVNGGAAILLPGNFGVIGNQVYELPRLVEAELQRRAQALGWSGLDKTKVIVKNDSFTLASVIGSDPTLKKGERVKLVFAGTGLGETTIASLGKGIFLDRATESGHLKLSAYPTLASLWPASFLKAAEVVRRASGAPDLELENIVAGGRRERHLSGLLSVLVSARLPSEKIPKWILEANAAPFDIGTDRARFHLDSQHPADLIVADEVATVGSTSLEKIALAARDGGPMANAIMDYVTFMQGSVVGVLASEFGATPSGQTVPARLAFGGLPEHRIERTVHVRADGALAAWPAYSGSAQKGFEAGLRSQFETNPEYRAKLKEAGVDPNWTRSFRLAHNGRSRVAADPDLQGLATLTRQNFVAP